MPVTINIHGENAGEALRELTVFSAGITGTPAAVIPEQPKTDKPARNSRNNAVKTEPDKKEEPAKQADPEPENAEEDDIDDLLGGNDESGDEPIPTDVELRAAATEAQKRHAGNPEDAAKVKKAIKALLDKYGSPNVTGVAQDKRIAFKRELEAL